MTLENTLFIGNGNPNPKPQPFRKTLEHFDIIRDAIAGTPYVQSHDNVTLVANNSFVYAFNAYKSISLLLPELYHESAAVVLRQLWEVSLNLHWVGEDPETRSQDFLNFTSVNYRKTIQKSDSPERLPDFDAATEKFQSNFRFTDRRGREKLRTNFAGDNVASRAKKLGEPWKREYELVYHLTSMHAHGSPGAVMHGFMKASYPEPEMLERNSACLVAMLAIKVMVRNVNLLKQLGVIVDTDNVNNAVNDYQLMMGESNNEDRAG